MAQSVVKIKRKGQVTIPIELRRELNLKEGDTVVIQRTERGIELIRSEDVVDWTSGALSQYARKRHLEPQEIREIAAQAIAEQAASEIEA